MARDVKIRAEFLSNRRGSGVGGGGLVGEPAEDGPRHEAGGEPAHGGPPAVRSSLHGMERVGGADPLGPAHPTLNTFSSAPRGPPAPGAGVIQYGLGSPILNFLHPLHKMRR